MAAAGILLPLLPMSHIFSKGVVSVGAGGLRRRDGPPGGRETKSVYRRYAIVAEADLLEGVSKLATLHRRTIGGQSASSRGVRRTRAEQ